MKRVGVILILCLLFAPSALFAQQRNGEQRRAEFEKFKKERQEYITKEMRLTTEEATVFWPLCDELQKSKFELNKELRDFMRQLHHRLREGKSIPESDYKKAVALSASTKVKEAQMEEKYMEKFLAVIPAEKVFKYQKAEQNFARKAMEEQNKRGGRQRN